MIDKVQSSGLLRFQGQIFELENGCFEILKHEDFYKNISHYILRLYQLEHYDIVAGVIDKIGECTCDPDIEVRAQAIQFLMGFAEKVEQQHCVTFSKNISTIICEWLVKEVEISPEFGPAALQLQDLVLALVKMQWWDEVEGLVKILHRIQCGKMYKDARFRRMISRTYHGLSCNQELLQFLVETYLYSEDERGKEAAKVLLLHLGDEAGRYLINELFGLEDKEDRSSILDIIPTKSSVVVPAVMQRFGTRQPWYVIRNSLVLLSRLGDPDLYVLARPFLIHKDNRVQQQVIDCIVKFGGGLSSRLLEALPLVDDSLKLQVVEMLGRTGGKEVGEAFIALLVKRASLSPEMHDDLVAMICTQRLFDPSDRTESLIKEIIEERVDSFNAQDLVLFEAQSLLSYLRGENRDNCN